MIIEKTKVGSIGAAWPPSFDRRNQRMKGFCPFRVDSHRTYRRLMMGVTEAIESNPQATRTTVRAFVSREFSRRTPWVEARFPADRVLPGFELVYLGFNRESRRANAEVLQEELASVSRISRQSVNGSRQRVFERVSSGGYSVESLNGARLTAVRQLLELYHEAYQEYTFELNEGTVNDMLSNGNIVLVGRSSDGTIVSSLIAEHATVPVDGRDVHLYELSDYATLRAHRRNGLITAMQIMAIQAIRGLPHGEESIIYAEDRAAWEAVNISSHKAGLVYAGTLEKHCVLVSDRTFAEEGRLENLNVWVSP